MPGNHTALLDLETLQSERLERFCAARGWLIQQLLLPLESRRVRERKRLILDELRGVRVRNPETILPYVAGVPNEYNEADRQKRPAEPLLIWKVSRSKAQQACKLHCSPLDLETLQSERLKRFCTAN